MTHLFRIILFYCSINSLEPSFEIGNYVFFLKKAGKIGVLCNDPTSDQKFSYFLYSTRVYGMYDMFINGGFPKILVCRMISTKYLFILLYLNILYFGGGTPSCMNA